jgi:glycine cleavage system aminomethyltransferase T
MILNEQGLTQDDILVYRNPKNDGFFVVINAGNTDRDLGIMRASRRASTSSSRTARRRSA